MKSLKKISIFVAAILACGIISLPCKAVGSDTDGDELDIAICVTSIEFENTEKELVYAEPCIFRIYKYHESMSVRRDAETWLIDRQFSLFSKYLQLKVKLDNLLFLQHLQVVSKLQNKQMIRRQTYYCKEGDFLRVNKSLKKSDHASA